MSLLVIKKFYSANMKPRMYSAVTVFSLILPGPVCDEPAEGKRKGRPKAEVQELRSIPVSISLNRGGNVKLAFFFFNCWQLLVNMEYIYSTA